MSDRVQAAALDRAVDFVLKDPARNFGRLLDWAERFDVSDEYSVQIETVRLAAGDLENVRDLAEKFEGPACAWASVADELWEENRFCRKI